MWPFTKWPIKVEIFEPRQDGSFFAKKDLARRIMKDSRQYYQLKKAKVKTKPIPYKYIYTSDDGSHNLKMFSPTHGVFVPMQVDTNSNKLNILDEDTRRWIVMDEIEISRRFRESKKWWETYYPVILLAIFALGIMFVFYGYGQLAEVMMEKSNAFARVMESAAQYMAQVMGATPPPA